MKKSFLTTTGIFLFITLLCLASNFIRWDETPLEQTMFALPLALGLFIQMPILAALGLFFRMSGESMNYELIWTLSPFFTSTFYIVVYYMWVILTCKLLPREKVLG